MTALGVPEDQASSPDEWVGWTAGLVRRGWQQIAAEMQVNPNELLAQATALCQRTKDRFREQARGSEQTVQELRNQMELRERYRRQARLLSNEQALAATMRYEVHLSRQMLQALHALERLQAARAGLPVQPPAVLDVTVETSQEMPPALLGAARR